MKDNIGKDVLIEIVIAMIILLAFSIAFLLPILLLPILVPGVSTTCMSVVAALLLFVLVMCLQFYLRKSHRYRALALVVFLVGLALMVGAYSIRESDLIWNVNIFACGVTVVALGMTLLTVFYRRIDNRVIQQLTREQDDTKGNIRTNETLGKQALRKEALWGIAAIAFVALVAILLTASKKSMPRG